MLLVKGERRNGERLPGRIVNRRIERAGTHRPGKFRRIGIHLQFVTRQTMNAKAEFKRRLAAVIPSGVFDSPPRVRNTMPTTATTRTAATIPQILAGLRGGRGTPGPRSLRMLEHNIKTRFHDK